MSGLMGSNPILSDNSIRPRGFAVGREAPLFFFDNLSTEADSQADESRQLTTRTGKKVENTGILANDLESVDSKKYS